MATSKRPTRTQRPTPRVLRKGDAYAGDSKEFLRNILDSSTEYSIVAVDLHGKVVLWNQGATNVFGHSAQEAVGRLLHAGLFSASEVAAGRPEEIMAETRKEGQSENILDCRRKNDEGFRARVVMTLRRDASGQPIGYLVISKDVTSEERYARSLIEASLEPRVTISPLGKITEVNEATVKATGVPRERLIGTDFSDYFTDPAKAREGYQQVFKNGFVAEYPLAIRHKNGMLTDVLYNATVYKDTAGKLLGVFAAARDVTAQKRVEAELAEQRNRDLARLMELEEFQKITVGRELRMIALKKELEELRKTQAAAG